MSYVRMEFCGQLAEILMGNDDAEDHVHGALFNDEMSHKVMLISIRKP